MDIFDVARQLGDEVYLAEVAARRSERWRLLLPDEAVALLNQGMHEAYVRDLYPLRAVRVQGRLLRDTRIGLPRGHIRGNEFINFAHQRWNARSLEAPRFEHMPFAVRDRLYAAEAATMMGVEFETAYEGLCNRIAVMVAAVAGWLVLPDAQGLGVGDAEACARGLMMLDEITDFERQVDEQAEQY